MGNGVVTMSNIFLSTALLTLAQKEIGCYDENIECGKVYGYKPSSLITIIGTISGLLSALFLPLIGSIVDTTSYRRTLGVVACAVLMSVQAIQIGTTQDTWFFMAILQALNGFIFQIVLLVGYSYLPEIGRLIGGELMNHYSAEWSVIMFVMQVFYMFTVIGLSLCLELDDVETGQLGQAVNVPASGICYYLAWKFFTTKEAGRRIPNDETIIWSGFKQVVQTTSSISKHYGPSLGWFLLAVVFAEVSGPNNVRDFKTLRPLTWMVPSPGSSQHFYSGGCDIFEGNNGFQWQCNWYSFLRGDFEQYTRELVRGFRYEKVLSKDVNEATISDVFAC
jgi:MFS family permease